jgi:predicted nucleic-acid-binding protein
MASRATAALAREQQLLLTDLVLAECVYVLESFYEVERPRVAGLMRSALALPSIKTIDPASLLRALEIYELDRVDFAEAYPGRFGLRDEVGLCEVNAVELVDLKRTQQRRGVDGLD